MSAITKNADAIRERIGDRLVIVSVSGGKDSAATCLHLRELGIDCIRIFADTGWENAKTYEYLRGPLTEALGPVMEVRREKGGMADLVRQKGMFPSRTRRFCTQELKVIPLAGAVHRLAEHYGRDVVNVVGIRAAESAGRALMPEWEHDATFDCDVWRPILAWSEEDVIRIHQRHGLRPNPLYFEGATRVGCWPCIHARKSEIRLIAKADPKRIDEIRDLEREVQAAAAASRYRRLGDSLEARGYEGPTFFQAANPVTQCVRCKGTGLVSQAMAEALSKPTIGQASRKAVASAMEAGGEADTACPKCSGLGRRRGMIKIDDAVAWSKTPTRGRSLEMFAAPHDGCARWGMCEATSITPLPENVGLDGQATFAWPEAS